VIFKDPTFWVGFVGGWIFLTVLAGLWEMFRWYKQMEKQEKRNQNKNKKGN